MHQRTLPLLALISSLSVSGSACRIRDHVAPDFPLHSVADAGALGLRGSTTTQPDAAVGGAAGFAMPATADAYDAGAVAAASQDAGAAAVEDPACDLNGIWIARQTTFSRDSVFNAVQTASNWFYYQITQQGRDVTVVHSLDCGIQASGSADATINRATTQALLTRNDQAGRHGLFYREGDHCVFTLERFYATRGVPRASYLPANLASNPDLSTIMPALPTQANPAGNEDWDGDGQPGITFNVATLGSRHVVQRDWSELFSDASYSIALQASHFVVRATFDNQEQILAVTGGLSGLLLASSTPATDLHHRITFQRLGRNATDPSVTAVRVAADIDTCYNVQDALPHDPAMQ